MVRTRLMTADMRQELVGDAARATPVAAYLVTVLNGVDWGAVAAMLAAIYTMILIIEKLWKLIVAPLLARKLLVPAHSRDPANE